MGQSDVDYYVGIVKEIDEVASDRVTSWEADFMESILTKFNERGKDLYLSKKQMAKLDAMKEMYLEKDKS